MRRRQAKKVYRRYARVSADGRVPPHLRNKWVRRYYCALLKDFDKVHSQFDMIKYYVYSKRTGRVRVADTASQAMWENWNCGKRFIKLTEFEGDRFVSTVFLQFDHGFFSDHYGHPPVLFETMYFNGPRNGERQTRDTSYKDALATHDAMVKSVQEEIEAIKATVEEITK